MIESEEYIKTQFGNVLVNIYGNRTKHPILTFHDIGLNAQDNFHDFFVENTDDIFGTNFCIYNINAPGQEIMAKEFPVEYHFPTIDELVILIEEVVKFYNFDSFVGLGIGAGAHLMLKYAVKNPNKVEALILINCVETKIGWLEWAEEKLNVELLRDFGMTKFTENYLLWHHFGQRLWECRQSDVNNFREYYEMRPNPDNVAAFINSYLHRTNIELHKDDRYFTIPILQIVGARSAFVKDAEYLHSMLQKQVAEIVKLQDCGGNVLGEKPAKAAEAILLFLQGFGFVPWINVHETVKGLLQKEETSVIENSEDNPLELAQEQKSSDQQSKIKELQQQVDEVKNIMENNLVLMAERGEKLAKCEEITEDLSQSAEKLDKQLHVKEKSRQNTTFGQIQEKQPKTSHHRIKHMDEGIEIIADETDEYGEPIAGFYHGAPGVKHHYHHVNNSK